MEAFGITVKYVKENVPKAYEELITEKTRVVFAETIENPKLDVTDIEAIAKIAHLHKLPFIVDNTVATPYLIRPITLGADVVVNSSSKYINGNSDAISDILTYGGIIRFKGQLMTYDALKMDFHTIHLPNNCNCAVCGEHPTITKLIDYEQAECDLKH